MNRCLPLALVCALVPACGGTPSAHPETPAHDGAVKAPGEAKIGDKTRCPVTGEEFTVGDDSAKSTYEGKTYFYCCPGCKKKFEADPKKYLSKT